MGVMAGVVRVLCAVEIVGLAAPNGASASPEPAVPADLLVEVAAPPERGLRDLQSLVDLVAPCHGGRLTRDALAREAATLVGVQSLDGIDLASPSYLFVADLQGTLSIALLGKVANASALRAHTSADQRIVERDWVMIGSKAMLASIGKYAFATRAGRPPPAALRATVYMSHLLAHQPGLLQQASGRMLPAGPSVLGGWGAQIAGSFVGWLGDVAHDTEKIVITLATEPGLGALDIALVPRAGSQLAKLVAVQRPASYAMFDQLPASRLQLLLGGRIDAGPYYAGYLAQMTKLYGPGQRAALSSALTRLGKASSGEFAIAGELAAHNDVLFTYLFELSDRGAASGAISSVLDVIAQSPVFQLLGISATHTANPGSLMQRGVMLHSYTMTPSASTLPLLPRLYMQALLPKSIEIQIATFDDTGMLVAAPSSVGQAQRVIDAARGASPHLALDAVAGCQLAVSRARGDSFMLLADLGAIVQAQSGQATDDEPVMMFLGFADRNAHLRVAATAPALRDLFAAFGPACPAPAPAASATAAAALPPAATPPL